MLSLWRAEARERRAGLLSESGQFAWKEFWRLSHVSPEFVPDDSAAAFEIYHFFGMCGHSEAAAESVAGTLKVLNGSFNGSSGHASRGHYSYAVQAGYSLHQING